MSHIHKEAIIAWANGAEIEYWDEATMSWKITTLPCWNQDTQYRIKPTPKPDEVVYGRIIMAHGLPKVLYMCNLHFIGDNIKLTFDGETGKLKAAEVINNG